MQARSGSRSGFRKDIDWLRLKRRHGGGYHFDAEDRWRTVRSQGCRRNPNLQGLRCDDRSWSEQNWNQQRSSDSQGMPTLGSPNLLEDCERLRFQVNSARFFQKMYATTNEIKAKAAPNSPVTYFVIPVSVVSGSKTRWMKRL